jgi:hypothetical protein
LIFLFGKRLLHGVFANVEFASERFSESGQLLVASDPIHSLFGLQKAEGEPPGSLLGVMPALDVADVFAYEAVQILDCIGRFEAPTDLLEYPEAVKRERLLQPLL